MLYVSLVINLFDFSILQKLDISLIVFVLITSCLYTIMFAYITNNMQQEKVNEEKKMSEFKQFQDMFNSL